MLEARMDLMHAAKWYHWPPFSWNRYTMYRLHACILHRYRGGGAMCTPSREDGGMLYLFNEGVPFRFSLLSFLFQTLASSPLRVSTPLLYNPSTFFLRKNRSNISLFETSNDPKLSSYEYHTSWIIYFHAVSRKVKKKNQFRTIIMINLRFLNES